MKNLNMERYSRLLREKAADIELKGNEEKHIDLCVWWLVLNQKWGVGRGRYDFERIPRWVSVRDQAAWRYKITKFHTPDLGQGCPYVARKMQFWSLSTKMCACIEQSCLLHRKFWELLWYQWRIVKMIYAEELLNESAQFSVQKTAFMQTSRNKYLMNYIYNTDSFGTSWLNRHGMWWSPK